MLNRNAHQLRLAINHIVRSDSPRKPTHVTIEVGTLRNIFTEMDSLEFAASFDGGAADVNKMYRAEFRSFGLLERISAAWRALRGKE